MTIKLREKVGWCRQPFIQSIFICDKWSIVLKNKFGLLLHGPLLVVCIIHCPLHSFWGEKGQLAFQLDQSIIYGRLGVDIVANTPYMWVINIGDLIGQRKVGLLHVPTIHLSWSVLCVTAVPYIPAYTPALLKKHIVHVHVHFWVPRRYYMLGVSKCVRDLERSWVTESFEPNKTQSTYK